MKKAGLALVSMSALTLASGVMAADRTGKEIVEAVCISCHGSGKDGAPRIGNIDDWTPRTAKGLDKLTENAIQGVKKMPAHGGQAGLSDLEMTRAIAYMISGGRTPDPTKPYGKVTSASGEQIVNATCAACHAEGKNGAPKIGDLEAWKPRLQKGLDKLAESAIKGHNNMPARGGMSNLSDVDINAAVAFMASKVGSGAKH